MKILIDKYGRKIDYLRISVTDRCNLSCIYCIPKCGVLQAIEEEMLSIKEIVSFVKVAASHGIRKIKITGGEPLLRKDIAALVSCITEIDSIMDISMTTNGVLIKKFASELKRAGLKRLNISLDSLCSDKYKEITKYGELKDVLTGIERAMELGFSQIKVNTVIIRDINLDEILDFVHFSTETGIAVRFIEYMPTKNSLDGYAKKFVSADEMRFLCNEAYSLLPAAVDGNGPAKYYVIPGTNGTIGFISPLSCKFCSDCNRIRLTSDGRLVSCLYTQEWVDIKNSLRKGPDIDEVTELLFSAIASKPASHSLIVEDRQMDFCSMMRIGG
ncbi:cyclic pyranopterin monophosphate synthase [Ruminiclostridium hungatei]|uniref:GTP 3',8-cyclase n=1 Tax=Ruminiclostridium hungatei TaxID=48256 RepID=A0A1V4SJ35_RUMHU|nr:GTP 3',8-cyclase MoaA [Ruminiclostridium hungatei]OPX43912.1 cyclic pyranopterin monophosphate synthase [Ruminiclostridium hungatei]